MEMRELKQNKQSQTWRQWEQKLGIKDRDRETHQGMKHCFVGPSLVPNNEKWILITSIKEADEDI